MVIRYSSLFLYVFVYVVIRISAENVTNSSSSNEFKYVKYFKNMSAINATTLPDSAREVISQVSRINN